MKLSGQPVLGLPIKFCALYFSASLLHRMGALQFSTYKQDMAHGSQAGEFVSDLATKLGLSKATCSL